MRVFVGGVVATIIAVCILGSGTARAEELPRPGHNWELAAGFTPLSYGLYDALGGDGHFDQFTTLPAAGLEVATNYHYRRYLVLGATAAYVFSLGRSNYWSQDYEPGVHRFRLGPQLQLRVPGESIEPFVSLGGGLSALKSKNYGDSYNATGFYGSLGLGGNIHMTRSISMYVRSNLTFDHAVINSMDGGYRDYMEDAGVVSFLMEVTLGILLRL